MFTRVLSCASLVTLLVLLGTGDADARPGARQALQTAPGVALRVQRTVELRGAPPAAARAAWTRLVADLGPSQAIWDRDTGVPTRIWGAALPAPGALASAPAARRSAEGFLAAHLDLLAPGSRLEDFALVSDDLSAGIRSLGYVQHYRGRPVVGGQLSLRYKHDHLALIGSEALPHVTAALTENPIAPADARARALAWLAGEAPAAETGNIDGPVILPIAGPGKALRYREAVAVEVRSEQPLGRWTVYLDAATGEPLARVSTLHEATGAVRYAIPQRSPSYGERLPQPAAFLDVTVDGAPATTDAEGLLTLAEKQVELGLGVRGDFVRIANLGGDLATLTLPLAADGEVLWDGASDPAVDAQLTAYVAANFAKTYVRAIAGELAWLDDQVTVSVNSGQGQCNAMSDGDKLYFYEGSAQCENTARIPDVVYHEAGHSVHNQALIPGVGLFEGALSEGISDYLSATITGDPKIARGFFLDEDPLRDLDPANFEWHWPEHRGPVHDEGRIIGGTLWDLRVALIAEMGEAAGIAHTDKIWYEATRRAVDIPSMYPEALLVDDDDGDLSNGTPHSCAIDQVFYQHGLVGALVLGGEVHTEAPTGDGAVPVALDIHAAKSECIDLAPTGATLEWRVRGATDSTTAAMTPSATGFAAALPAQPDGTVLEYRVVADLSDGTKARYPTNEAYPWYQRYFGPVTPIYCTSFETDPAADGWELFGEWQAGAPLGRSGDPEAAFDGATVLGLDLDGDGRYGANRVSNLRSPTIDVSGFPGVRLQYRRWLGVEDAYFDQATILADDQPVWENFNSDQGDQNSDVHHRDGEWNFHDVDLTAQAKDGTVQLTFRLASDGGLELGGWNLDALCLVGVTAQAAQICGDGLVGGAEQCDDGNTADGDGCSATCTTETAPTTGADPAETGDPADDSATSGGLEYGDLGCGCRSTGSAPPVSSAALLLLAALGRRRRARG